MKTQQRREQQMQVDADRPCRRKRQYGTKTVALQEANRQGARYGMPLRVYRCPTCHEWHLTKRLEKGKP